MEEVCHSPSPFHVTRREKAATSLAKQKRRRGIFCLVSFRRSPLSQKRTRGRERERQEKKKIIWPSTRPQTRPDSRRLQNRAPRKGLSHWPHTSATRDASVPSRPCPAREAPCYNCRSVVSSPAQKQTTSPRQIDRPWGSESARQPVAMAAVEVCVKAAAGKPDTLGDCECSPRPCPLPLSPPRSIPLGTLTALADGTWTCCCQARSRRGCCSRWRRRKSPTRSSSSTSATSPNGPSVSLSLSLSLSSLFPPLVVY